MSGATYEKLDRPAADEHSDSPDDYAGRTSADVRQHDYETLTAEEEAGRLLGGSEKKAAKRREKRGSGKGRRRRLKGEESELMYEMEEGGPRASSDSSGNSSEVDLQKLGETQARQKVGGRRVLGQVCCKADSVSDE